MLYYLNSIIKTKITFGLNISKGLISYINALYTNNTNGYSTEGFIYFYNSTPIS